MDRTRRSRALNALRLVAIVCFGSWVWQGPVRNHYDKRSTLSWDWSLFRAQGTKACDVQFFERMDGDERYVERWRLFGYDAPRQMPRHLRVISPERMRAHVSSVCRTLRAQRGDDVDVRAVIRCPTLQAWRVLEDGPANVCAPEYLRDSDRLASPKKKKKKKKTTNKRKKTKNKRKRTKKKTTSGEKQRREKTQQPASIKRDLSTTPSASEPSAPAAGGPEPAADDAKAKEATR